MLSNTREQASNFALKNKNKDLSPFTKDDKQDTMPHPATDNLSVLQAYELDQRSRNV